MMEHFGIRELRNNIGRYAAEAEAGSISIISKNGSPLTVNIPFDSTLISLGVNKSMAVKLYNEGVLTLAKAAKLSAMTMDDFISLLGAAGISVMGYDSRELGEEFE
jgi:predicted HTH domain antitoxin